MSVNDPELCPWMTVGLGACPNVANVWLLANYRGSLCLRRCCPDHLIDERSMHAVEVLSEEEATVWEVMFP